MATYRYMLGVVHPGCGGRYGKDYTSPIRREMVKCYRCNHLMPAWQDGNGNCYGSFPLAERVVRDEKKFGPFGSFKELSL